jgi:hypothetical protein
VGDRTAERLERGAQTIEVVAPDPTREEPTGAGVDRGSGRRRERCVVVAVVAVVVARRWWMAGSGIVGLEHASIGHLDEHAVPS